MSKRTELIQKLNDDIEVLESQLRTNFLDEGSIQYGFWINGQVASYAKLEVCRKVLVTLNRVFDRLDASTSVKLDAALIVLDSEADRHIDRGLARSSNHDAGNLVDTKLAREWKAFSEDGVVNPSLRDQVIDAIKDS